MNRRILSPRVGLLVSAASIAVLAAACSNASTTATIAGTVSTAGTSAIPSSSTSSATSSTAAGSSTYQKAVAYAACMRQHGVPNFPDPLPNGGFEISSDVTGGGNGQVSPQYAAAVNACASLLPSGSPSAQQQQKTISELLKVSACMRTHGFATFPDPTVGNEGTYLHIVGFDRNSPQFQSAWATCTQGARGGTQG
jgi:hypothetical protein